MYVARGRDDADRHGVENGCPFHTHASAIGKGDRDRDGHGVPKPAIARAAV